MKAALLDIVPGADVAGFGKFVALALRKLHFTQVCSFM
jgi:hypothetical protein